MNIYNGVAVCGVLSDDELINAILHNDDESDVEEVPLRPTVTEATAATAALSVLGGYRFSANAGYISHLEHFKKVVVPAHFTALKQTKLTSSFCK